MQSSSNDQEVARAAEQLSLLPASAGNGVAPKSPKQMAAAVAKVIRRRYKQGTTSSQPMLLPPSVDDYVASDNPVRALNAYVNTLDLGKLQFKNTYSERASGQPAFNPADLLKLYLYGYLNRVRSSRRLEVECVRNLEMMWLLNGLRPGYHTIADFRKDNADALKAVNRDFVQLCRELGLFGGKLIGIDGSFFNGDASAASTKTKKQLQAELAAIEHDIERYQQALNSSDEAEKTIPEDAAASAEQLAALEARVQKKTGQIEHLDKTGETQLSRTDPDARRLSKNGKKVTGYNVQTVVDDEHKLILAHEVTNAGNDFGQLDPMVALAQQALAEGETPASSPAPDGKHKDRLEVVADAGYYTEADIAACEARSVTAYVAIPDKHRRMTAAGRLAGRDFHYDPQQNVYICPEGQRLLPIGKPSTKSKVARQRYRSKAAQCKTCPQRASCLPKKTPTRQIYRSEYAESVERHGQRMENAKEKMRQRAEICEHPFGTMKRWLGWDHFLVRGFKKVRGEMALLVNCYNLRRLLTIFGVDGFIAICEERRRARLAEGGNDWLCGLLSTLIQLLQARCKRFFRTGQLFHTTNHATAATHLPFLGAL